MFSYGGKDVRRMAKKHQQLIMRQAAARDSVPFLIKGKARPTLGHGLIKENNNGKKTR